MLLKVEQEIQQNHRLVVAICEDHHGCLGLGNVNWTTRAQEPFRPVVSVGCRYYRHNELDGLAAGF